MLSAGRQDCWPLDFLDKSSLLLLQVHFGATVQIWLLDSNTVCTPRVEALHAKPGWKWILLQHRVFGQSSLVGNVSRISYGWQAAARNCENTPSGREAQLPLVHWFAIYCKCHCSLMFFDRHRSEAAKETLDLGPYFEPATRPVAATGSTNHQSPMHPCDLACLKHPSLGHHCDAWIRSKFQIINVMDTKKVQ